MAALVPVQAIALTALTFATQCPESASHNALATRHGFRVTICAIHAIHNVIHNSAVTGAKVRSATAAAIFVAQIQAALLCAISGSDQNSVHTNISACVEDTRTPPGRVKHVTQHVRCYELVPRALALQHSSALFVRTHGR
mmetsp:Transcript_12693/g.32466  ORF Transcript_12693/g.32466 Transcript_12693/m.32466 type:complete len:140 (-) Transcript_12693:1584-2003(-)